MALRVAVIGGGISGLTTAHELLNAGHVPIIMESSDEIGGLRRIFKDFAVDPIAEPILEASHDLLDLIDDLDLTQNLVWRDVHRAVYLDGATYAVGGPMSFLRFPLPPMTRLRCAAGALAMQRVSNQSALDGRSAADYLRGLFGSCAFARIWKPYLRGRFGDSYETVSASAAHGRLRQEMAAGRAGYLRGGSRILAEALRTSILGRGGEIHRNTTVSAVDDDGGAILRIQGELKRFDAAISTLPPPSLDQIARGRLQNAIPMSDMDYQDTVTVVLASTKPLSHYYQTTVLDHRLPFASIVESTHVLSPENTGGRHLIHLIHHGPAEGTDAHWIRAAMNGLAALYPGFRCSSLDSACVFRSRSSEPIWPVGPRRLPIRAGNSSLYLCTTAQGENWNARIALAHQVVSAMSTELAPVWKGRTPVEVAVGA